MTVGAQRALDRHLQVDSRLHPKGVWNEAVGIAHRELRALIGQTKTVFTRIVSPAQRARNECAVDPRELDVAWLRDEFGDRARIDRLGRAQAEHGHENAGAEQHGAHEQLSTHAAAESTSRSNHATREFASIQAAFSASSGDSPYGVAA